VILFHAHRTLVMLKTGISI